MFLLNYVCKKFCISVTSVLQVILQNTNMNSKLLENTWNI